MLIGRDVPLDLFGGLVTDMAASDLPHGVSPDCQDVAFVPGAVKTRPGLASLFAAIAGNPTINYLKTFEQPNLTEVLLALDSSGALWQASTTGGGLSQINTGPGGKFIAPNCRAKSTTLFGREYIAFHDGKFGIDIPRQYDGANFDRVSQCGVGGVGPSTNTYAFSAGNGTVAGPFNLASSGGDTIKRLNGIVYAQMVAADYFSLNPYVGMPITIAGVADNSYNGNFTVLGSGTDNGTIYVVRFVQAGANSTSTGGTITQGALLSAGTHQVCCAFQTRQGFITIPCPPISWTASGTAPVQLINIPLPLNDANVVARILIFTAAGGDTFYYTTGADGTPKMVINDTSTTSLTLDFTDAVLLSGTLATPLFNQVELGECAGFIGYAERLFAWGERNKVPNFQNMSFDGGFAAVGGGVRPPLGWASDGTFGALG